MKSNDFFTINVKPMTVAKVAGWAILVVFSGFGGLSGFRLIQKVDATPAPKISPSTMMGEKSVLTERDWKSMERRVGSIEVSSYNYETKEGHDKDIVHLGEKVDMGVTNMLKSIDRIYDEQKRFNAEQRARGENVDRRLDKLQDEIIKGR